jgi:arsenite methyltransferase
MDNDHKESIRKQVSDHYARVAEQGANICRGVRGVCCGQSPINISSSDLASGVGYTARVGEKGHVIGVDLTEEVIRKARENARLSGYKNVEFRFGEIERLPIPDNSIDVIMSNCAINLSPDKRRVYAEAFRVLRPGGRLGIFDVVATAPLPDEIKTDLSAYINCVAGAAPVDELKNIMRATGFESIKIDLKEKSREFIREWMPGKGAEKYVVSAAITAAKPRGAR